MPTEFDYTPELTTALTDMPEIYTPPEFDIVIPEGLIHWQKNTITFGITTLGCSGKKVVIEILKGSDLVTTLVYPVIGTELGYDFKVQIDRLLGGLLEPERPSYLTAAVLKNVEYLPSGITQYTFKVSLSDSIVSKSRTRLLMKGGIHNMSFINEPDINLYATMNKDNFLPYGSRFLTWVPSGRLLDPEELSWLTYFHDLSDRPKVVYNVTYMDGSTATFETAFPDIPGGDYSYKLWYIPIGVLQAGLDPTGKGVSRYFVRVHKATGVPVKYAEYLINVDNRPFYHWLNIHYRNSIGGWDNFRFHGQIEHTTEPAKGEYDLKHSNRFGGNPHYNASLRFKWKANTGYIDKQHMIALNDLLNSTDCGLIFEGKWLQLRCLPKTFTWLDTRDGLHNEVFEFDTAGTFTTLPVQLMKLNAKYPEVAISPIYIPGI